MAYDDPIEGSILHALLHYYAARPWVVVACAAVVTWLLWRRLSPFLEVCGLPSARQRQTRCAVFRARAHVREGSIRHCGLCVFSSEFAANKQRSSSAVYLFTAPTCASGCNLRFEGLRMRARADRRFQDRCERLQPTWESPGAGPGGGRSGGNIGRVVYEQYVA